MLDNDIGRSTITCSRIRSYLPLKYLLLSLSRSTLLQLVIVIPHEDTVTLCDHGALGVRVGC
jgi:hypothetical protein